MTSCKIKTHNLMINKKNTIKEMKILNQMTNIKKISRNPLNPTNLNHKIILVRAMRNLKERIRISLIEQKY